MSGSVLALRHGRTAWNTVRRIQGRVDEPLCDEGRARLRGRGVPIPYRSYEWVSSPLQRCLETVSLLGGPAHPEVEPRLVEMSWGEWEGSSLEVLRQREPDRMRANEARGLDFRPPGGESPRQVGERLAPWLAAIGRDARRVVVVSHKGVLRALLARALAWDMTGKAPVRLDWERAHLFTVDRDGTVTLREANIPLLVARGDRGAGP